MKSLRLLAVDDYAPSRYAHTRVLREAGFHVYEADDGYTGLALAQVHLPHVVLLDVNLPDIHGFEVCERLKAQRLTSRMAVIHITATSRGDEYRRQSIAAGADLFMEEPVESNELIRAVQSVASRRLHAGTVLLLSPYADESEMYAAAIEDAGYHVVAGTPQSGYELARNVLPDVIVTRIRPEEAGLDVARAVKRDALTSHVPIVIITTYGDAVHRAAADSLGVARYFILPTGPAELLQAINELTADHE